MTPFDAEELLRDGARLRALAHDLVRGAADVDDLVQETWLRALAKPVRTGFSPRAWFAGLARNVARERRRADRRREDHERAAAPSLPSSGSPADDPAEVAARFDLLRRLLSFIDALAEPQRTTLIRRYVDGLEPTEIARLDGIPDATVRSRIKRGLDELRARLDAERGGDRAAWMAALLPWSRPSAVTATAVVFEGLALNWIAFAAAGVLAIAGVAVVAARAKPGRDDPAQVAARPRAAQDGSPASPLALPAEAAVRVADLAGSAAAERALDGARTKAGWRIEGRLLGLDPSTPWTGTIRVVSIANGVLNFFDGSQGVEAPLVGDRFAADLVPPAAEPGASAPWRAWQVTASDPAYVDVRALVDVLDDHGVPRAPCTLQVELTTRPSARVHGRVVDEAGAAVPSMDVGWRDSDGDDAWLEEQHTRTDATGRYSIEVPRLGPTYVATWIEAEKPCDLLAALVRVDLHLGADVAAPDLVMRRGVTIRGLVVDGDGDPEPGAIVSATPVWTPEELAAPTAESITCPLATADRVGEFELRGLRRGRWRLAINGRAGLRAHPSVGNSSTVRATEVDAPADSVELEDRLCRVELRLCVRGVIAMRTSFSIDGANPERTSNCVLGATTDDAGTFTFLAVPGFHFGIRCDLPGIEPTPKPFDVGVTERHRIVDLDFEARHPRASLALTLRDPAGGSVGRAWVRLEPLSDPALGAMEKALPEPVDGVFLVEDVDLGRYRAAVRAGGGHFGCGGFFEEETFDVDLLAPSRVEKTVLLRPTGRLRVYAVDSDGKRVRANITVVDELGRRSGVGLAMEEAGGASFSPVGTLSKPSFVVPPPPPGRYRVEFTADGYFPQSIDARVVPGETTDVAVTLLRR